MNSTINDISEWQTIPFQESIVNYHLPRSKQIKTKEYLKYGKYPIVDQGQELIGGYTNDEDKVIVDLQPFIIFGDHTRILKYIDFPIAIGADGTKIIKPNEKFDPKYLFFFLKNLDIPNRGYNRHFTILKERQVSLPSINEQLTISKYLTAIQEAISEQETLITKLKELKQSTMYYLFTKGTKGEKTKITEFGQIPASWKLFTVDEAIKESIIEKPIDGNHGNIHPKSKDFVNSGIPFIMASDLDNGNVDITNCHFITKKQADNLQKGFSLEGDILLSHKGTIGRTAIVRNIETDYIMLTPQVTYYRVKNDKILLNTYLKHFFDSEKFQTILKRIAGDGSTRAYIGILKQHILPIFIPSIDEQIEISKILDSIDIKIDLSQHKLKIYQELFKTLLHELMSEEQKLKKYVKTK